MLAFFDSSAGRRAFNFEKGCLTGAPEDLDNVFCTEFLQTVFLFSSSPDGKLPSKVKKKNTVIEFPSFNFTSEGF